MYEDIEYKVEGPVATITFNRPEKLNAVRRQTFEDLFSALDEAELDDRVRAVVFTGKGRAFCAGADLELGFRRLSPDDGGDGPDIFPDLGGQATLRLFEMRKPLIAAANGAGVGFGASVLLPMDFRLASHDARFGFVFSRRGIATDACSSWFLPRVVGISTATDWMMTGRIFDAQEAHRKGFIQTLCEPDKLLPAAMEIAEQIAANTSAMSVAMNRQLLWRMLGAEHPLIAHELESVALSTSFGMADCAEAVSAFNEKRSAKFTSTAADARFMDRWWDGMGVRPLTDGN
ncbi:MAG: enoyl-CoA hydratase-related protein [Mesorhizobium sp.]